MATLEEIKRSVDDCAAKLARLNTMLFRLTTRLSITCAQPCSQHACVLCKVKEEREKPPHTPLKEKEEERNNNNTPARVRVRKRMALPTLEEVTAYVKANGYTFNAAEFWNYYTANGWMVGKNPMISWKAACTAWQRNDKLFSGRTGANRKSSNWIGSTDAQRREFIDGLG